MVLCLSSMPIAVHFHKPPPCTLLADWNLNATAGKQRRWDMISSHSSVGVIIYHTHLDALLLVRQFRPAVSPSLPSPAIPNTALVHFHMLDATLLSAQLLHCNAWMTLMDCAPTARQTPCSQIRALRIHLIHSSEATSRLNVKSVAAYTVQCR